MKRPSIKEMKKFASKTIDARLAAEKQAKAYCINILEGTSSTKEHPFSFVNEETGELSELAPMFASASFDTPDGESDITLATIEQIWLENGKVMANLSNQWDSVDNVELSYENALSWVRLLDDLTGWIKEE